MTADLEAELRKLLGRDFVPQAFLGHNPMPKPCANCPFVMAAAGNDYLAPGRLDGIKFAVALGGAFPCHKTVHQKAVPIEVDDHGNERRPMWHRRYQQCAGAIEFVQKLAARMR